jgi:AcrR family transcriptional regulator
VFDERTLIDPRSRRRYAVGVPTMTRRERQQQALRRDVLDAALSQLDQGGPSAVNWRALARSVGVSPSTLYTYFEGLDALHTELIVEIYAQMAAEVARGVDAGEAPAVRLRQAMDGYRRFAVGHPSRFTLVFTDVLPGYVAPAGGPTIGAQTNVLLPLAEALAELSGESSSDITTWSAPNRARAIGSWSQLHGFVNLEANHHLDWLGGIDELFDATCDSVLSAATS